MIISRRVIAALVMVSAALVVLMSAAFVGIPRARAGGNNPSNVNVPAETEAIRDLLQKAMYAYRQGDFTSAFKLSRSAYLDHFENIEIPLRVADADLTLDFEYRFANLRTNMQAGAASAEVEASLQAVRDALDEVDGMFSSVGAMAPALAFGASFTIIFREGLEAVLVIAALLGYLQSGPGRRGRKHVFTGIGLALVVTLVTWVVLRFLISIAPVGRELLEAIIALVAVGLLFWVSFWLVRRLDNQRWMEFLRAKSWAAMASGSAIGLIGVGFTAVYREGFETALFYEVLLGMSRQVEVYVLLGFLVGAAALAVIAWFVLRAGRKLPVRTFMSVAVTIIILLSIAIAGQAVHDFQDAGLINVTSLIESFPRLPHVISEFTGIHPTVETLAAQAALSIVYLSGGLYMLWKSRSQTPNAIPNAIQGAS